MRRIIIAMLSVFTAWAVCYAGGKEEINFAETVYDFGTVKADHKPVTHEYEFTNISDVPLTILSVSASCGCTRPKYDPKPVQPGKSGKIKVTFLPKGQRGYISKNVKVRYQTAGGKRKHLTLKITGMVTPE